MDYPANNDGDIIHPAIRARLSRVSADRARQLRSLMETAILDLAKTSTSLRRTAEAMTETPGMTRILAAAEELLPSIGVVIQSWKMRRFVSVREIEDVAVCLEAIGNALRMALEIVAGGTAVSATAPTPDILLHNISG